LAHVFILFDQALEATNELRCADAVATDSRQQLERTPSWYSKIGQTSPIKYKIAFTAANQAA